MFTERVKVLIDVYIAVTFNLESHRANFILKMPKTLAQWLLLSVYVTKVFYVCVCVCSIFIQADVGILSRWLLVLPKLNNQYVFPKTFLRLFSVKCSCLFLLEQTSTYLNFIVFKEMSHSIIKQCIMTLSALVLFIYLYCFVVTCWVACLHLNTTKPVAFCLWCSKR